MDAKYIYEQVDEAFTDAVGQMAPEEEPGVLDPLVSGILGSVVPGGTEAGSTKITVGLVIDNSPSVPTSRLVRALKAIEASIAGLGWEVKRAIAFDLENPPNKLSTPKFDVLKLKSFASSGKPMMGTKLGPALEEIRSLINRVDIIFILSDFELADGGPGEDFQDLASAMKKIRRKAVFVNVGTRAAGLARKIPMMKSLLVRP
jgi:hypothetical protein